MVSPFLHVTYKNQILQKLPKQVDTWKSCKIQALEVLTETFLKIFESFSYHIKSSKNFTQRSLALFFRNFSDSFLEGLPSFPEET